MTITRGTDITRGLTPFQHLTPLQHTGVLRSSASSTPLEDAVKTLVDSFDSVQAEYWKPYDLTTLGQTDSSLDTPVTVANGTQVCGYVQGQRTTGNIHLTQATAANRPEVNTLDTMVGIKAVDSLDAVFNTGFSTLNQAFTLFVRCRSDSLFNGAEQYMITAANTWTSLAARGMIAKSGNTTPANNFAMYAGNVLSSSNVPLVETTYYLTAIYNTTASIMYSDGVEVISSSDAGAQTGNVAIGLCGAGGANTEGDDFMIEKACMIPVAASTAQRATIEAWMAVEGAA